LRISYMRWLGCVPPTADQHFPNQSRSGTAHLESAGLNQAVDLAHRVDKSAKGMPRPPPPGVLPSGVTSHVPPIMRIAQRIIPSGLLHRDLHQCPEVRPAANDSIHGHQVSHTELNGNGDGVAMHERNAILVPPTLRFLFRYIHVRTSRLDVHRPLHTPIEQLMVEDSDSRPDV